MKKNIKILFIIPIIILCICGCSKGWEKSVQISSLKYKDGYIKGRMKNLTDNAYDLTIIFKVKSGSLVEKKYCYELLKPNDTIDLECLANDIDDTYKIEVENISLKRRKIPKLTVGKIDTDTLKYHYEDIYEEHRLNYISFVVDIDDKEYPYIDEIEYKNDEIEIKGKITEGTNSFYYYETFDAKKEQLKYLNVLIFSDDEDFINTIITKLSLMPSISTSSNDSISIARVLKRKNIDSGYCIRVGIWCIGTDYSNGDNSLIGFMFERK